MSEVEKRNNEGNGWSVIYDKIYDLGIFVSKHPGGAKLILNVLGKDGTTQFQKGHGMSDPSAFLKDKLVGMVKK
jgi:cytochrome b involved in lipid metabolism